ncbi:MAG: tetratricopeptide repeat protein [Blastocatellia bacterium]
MKSPEESVAIYKQNLEAMLEQKDCKDSILSVLISRDEVHGSMKEYPGLTAKILVDLVNLDRYLKEWALKLTPDCESELKSWRESIQPQDCNWWWSLDKQSQPKAIWGILSLILATLAIGVTVEVMRRSLGSGIDLLTVISQTMLALLAGGAFTTFGQEFIENRLTQLGLRRQHQPIWKILIAFGALLSAMSLYLALPAIAKVYTNNLGVRYHQAGDIKKAVKSYERAISLDPDYAQAHYNLGSAYETSLELDKAITEYQVALRDDPKFYYAYNNLARLFLLRSENNASTTALTILNTALEQKPTELPILYAIYKNRAWAHLNLKLYIEAEKDVKRALESKPDGAAAYCIRAQILEAEKKSAVDDWGTCLANQNKQETPVEAVWLSIAREKMNEIIKKEGSK